MHAMHRVAHKHSIDLHGYAIHTHCSKHVPLYVDSSDARSKASNCWYLDVSGVVARYDIILICLTSDDSNTRRYAADVGARRVTFASLTETWVVSATVSVRLVVNEE